MKQGRTSSGKGSSAGLKGPSRPCAASTTNEYLRPGEQQGFQAKGEPASLGRQSLAGRRLDHHTFIFSCP